LRNGDFRDLYSSLNTVRVTREFSSRALGACGGEGNFVLLLVEKKLEGKQQFQKP